MMISPSWYKEQYKNLSLIELIDKRNELMKNINYFENNHIKDNKEYAPEEIIKPSPATKYHWHNEYLKVITDLILEKLKEEQKRNLESI